MARQEPSRDRLQNNGNTLNASESQKHKYGILYVMCILYHN